jgi:hypothetical protein
LGPADEPAAETAAAAVVESAAVVVETAAAAVVETAAVVVETAAAAVVETAAVVVETAAAVVAVAAAEPHGRSTHLRRTTSAPKPDAAILC